MEKIARVWLTEDAVCIRTESGREASEYFADYPRLRHATAQQRDNYVVNAFGIHWPDIDEDLSFEGFLEKKRHNDLYGIFIAHPELNASAVARRLGMSQSLLAQYLSSTKKPSKERIEMIKAEIHKIGVELAGA